MDEAIIGMDPHKASVTIVVRDKREALRATGRFGTDNRSYRQLLKVTHQLPRRCGSSRRQRHRASGRPTVAGVALLTVLRLAVVRMGGVTMAIGMLMHEVSVLVVIVNAMRLLRRRRHPMDAHPGSTTPPTPAWPDRSVANLPETRPIP